MFGKILCFLFGHKKFSPPSFGGKSYIHSNAPADTFVTNVDICVRCKLLFGEVKEKTHDEKMECYFKLVEEKEKEDNNDAS